MNTTCLGLSKGNPQGKGVGSKDTDDIFDSFLESFDKEGDIIQDLEDSLLFINGFGRDKLSDMTTNIITNSLIEYTQDQCRLHKIPLIGNSPSGFYWNHKTLRWEERKTDMFFIDEKKILLVPKGIVSFCREYTPEKYYQHFVLNFMQDEHIIQKTKFVKAKKDGTLHVLKKDLKAEFPCSKQFIADFSKEHPNILQKFKNQLKTKSVSNSEIEQFNIEKTTIEDLCKNLIDVLQKTPINPENSTYYHELITGILEVILYPNFVYPALDSENNPESKRLNLTFNKAFMNNDRFHQEFQLEGHPCQHILVECRNASISIENLDLDSLIHRFHLGESKVALLICRNFENFDSFIETCKDIYQKEIGLIIPLSDEDLINLLNNKNELASDYSNKFFSNRIKTIKMV